MEKSKDSTVSEMDQKCIDNMDLLIDLEMFLDPKIIELLDQVRDEELNV